LKATIDPSWHYLVLIGNDDISVRTPDQFQELFKAALSESTIAETALGWSPSGRYLSVGVRQLAIFDLAQSKLANVLPMKGWIRDVGWISEDKLSVYG
jgi:hypothetical protein